MLTVSIRLNILAFEAFDVGTQKVVFVRSSDTLYPVSCVITCDS